MNKYGYEVILCSKLDNQFIDRMDIKKYSDECKKIVFQVKNTKYIDKRTLKYLNELKKKYDIEIKISVVGPYIIKDDFDEAKKERFFYNTLYDLDELYQIIINFEDIESIIEPHLSQFDIAIYLVEIITRRIMYDPEYLLMRNKNIEIPKMIGEQSLADFYDRSLRGILTGKTLCAGYSVIFKELANRNGIKCKYVSGTSYTSSLVKLGGHAWNILKIDDVLYPLDITTKNTKYRNGDFINLESLSLDIDKFKMTHVPYDEKDNEGLTKIPEEIIIRAKQRTCIIKQYNSTTYTITRKDNSKFILSQLGTYKGLYKYLYSEINSDGSYKPCTVFFSGSNLVREINEKKFERSNYYDEFVDSFVNILFSKENINDSLINKKTNYIGCAELIGQEGFVKKILEIKKSDKAIKACMIPNILSYRIENGSIATLVQLKNDIDSDKTYGYFLYLLSDGPRVIEHDFYSNVDYFFGQAMSEINSIINSDSIISLNQHNSVKR